MAFKNSWHLASQSLASLAVTTALYVLLGRKSTEVCTRFLLVPVQQIAKVAPDLI